MTVVEAINILFQGVEAGRKAGIFSFQDAALINEAMNVLKGADKKVENVEQKPVENVEQKPEENKPEQPHPKKK